MKSKHIALLLTWLCAATSHAATSPSNIDSLYYFYQRTMYLEDLLQNGAWWSNPSRLASIQKPCVLTTNTGLLGGKYSLSSIRLVFPLRVGITLGFGLTGTSTKEGRSFSGNESGGTMTSNFNFSRPSLESGISYELPFSGTIGALMATGTESILSPTDAIRRYYFIVGMGLGYFSPPILRIVRLSASTMSVNHFQLENFWDHSAKCGVFFCMPDSLILGSIEYGFSLTNAFTFFRKTDSLYSYEVIKGTISIRFRSIAGFIVGFSQDSKNQRDNGPTLHTGLELRPSWEYPYWGGYEIGLSPWSSRHRSTSAVLTVMHRFWVGYSFHNSPSDLK